MKKKIRIPLLVVAAILVIATSQYPKLYVATGYGAKCMASGIFVAGGRYGAMIWLNRSGELPDAPADMISCNGHRGQRVFIVPSRQLVVVRLGFAADKFDHNQFLREILGAFKSPK